VWRRHQQTRRGGFWIAEVHTTPRGVPSWAFTLSPGLHIRQTPSYGTQYGMIGTAVDNICYNEYGIHCVECLWFGRLSCALFALFIRPAAP
jgi:hypothetical protein